MLDFTVLTTATRGILKNNPLLACALSATITHKNATAQAVIAWGQKPSRTKAVAFAQKHALPLITVEDGFLRSLDSGTDSVGASFVVDDVGVYFDLTAPNRLQQHIADTQTTWNDAQEKHAHALIARLIREQLSKYNATYHAPDLTAQAGNDKPHVIIIDQVANDVSIVGAGASHESFTAMLAHAKAHYPNANIWVKAHPAGKGHFTPHKADGVFYLDKPCNPIALLQQVQAVYTVSSHMGFEALMLGKRVHCFGVSWYAGFGLTDDDYIQNTPLYEQVQAHHRTLGIQNPSVSQLFDASYLKYSRYANPATGLSCDIETLMDFLVLNRDWQDKLSGDVLIYDFSHWKVPFVKRFLGFGGTKLHWLLKLRLAFLLPDGINAKRTNYRDRKFIPVKHAVAWGQKAKHTLRTKLPRADTTIWCMEDGFIRSNGLGATLLEPLSVVMDDVGIYFDATQPSRLETLLSTICLTDAQRQRAVALHQRLLHQRVSKYNVKTKSPTFAQQLAILAQNNTRIHLVVGQVEDDASVQSCCSVITKNRELLLRVRQDYPHDVIIYKPHPDVEMGLRIGQVDNACLANMVASRVAMPDCLDACDVVHTISSLTGFEALLRGKQVVCYGVPFYAGFGLTTDVVEADNLPKQQALSRRQRPTPLTIEELIFATLISYPMYHLPKGFGLAKPENVIDYLYDYQEVSGVYKNFTRKLKISIMQGRNFTK